MRKFLVKLLIFALLLSGSANSSIAAVDGDLRASVGLKIFQAILVAEQNVAANSGNQAVPLYILYVDDEIKAAHYRDELLTRIDSISKLPVSITTISLKAYLDLPASYRAGIFLSQRLDDDELQKVIPTAVRDRSVLFSPFEGDVERGVMSGIAVQASVRPYINKKALRNSSVKIKSFFLKVAKTYE